MQDYSDWEVVVSDNASDIDVTAYVASLRDPRIRALRIDRVVPVTDNWNASLEEATGDYFVMLGDDDALVPGALAQAASLVDAWRQPDAIYAQALQYAYANVVPGHAQPFTQIAYNEFLERQQAAFALPKDTALRMVRASMRFRVLYGYNMQHFVFSRVLVDKLRSKGPFFQSPYPDYYAANAILIAAQPVIATPRILTLIGISPKSFGYYYFNQREEEGVEFLRNVPNETMRERLRRVMVPGSNMNDSWLCAMETLALNFRDVPGLRVDHRRYRLLQFFATLTKKSFAGLATVLRSARWTEMLLYALPACLYASSYLLPKRYARKLRTAIWQRVGPYPTFDTRLAEVPFENILEAAIATSEGRRAL
jgi:hypothetical protein